MSPSTWMAPAKQSPIPAPTVMGYLKQPLTDNNPRNSFPEFHRCHSSNHITTATIVSTTPPCSTTTMTAPTTPLRSPPRRKSLELHLWFVLGCLALVVSFAFVQVEAGHHRVRRQHPLDQLQQDQLETQEQKSQHHRKVDKLVKDVNPLKDVGRFRYHGDRADDYFLTNDIEDDNRNDIVDDSAPSSDDHRGSRRHQRDHSRRQPRIRNSKHDDTRLSSYNEYIRIQGAEHNLSSRARPHRRARQQENKAGHRRRRRETDAVRRVRHIRKKDNSLVEISERLQDVYGDQWKTWQKEGRRDKRQQVEETVGCDRILGSSAREDRCRVCEGDGSTRTTIDGRIDRQGLTEGYNDILLIPLGATNIVVEEVEASNNYLAVRNLTGHYFFNGNWRIDSQPARQFAGTTICYKAVGNFVPEVIRALGPVLEPLYIALLCQEPNTGIRYKYSLPIKVARDLDETYTYKWRRGEWGECSLTCGGGSQNRTVTCASATDFVEVDTALCDPRLQPPENRTCNADPCQSSWQNGSWSDCTSSVCGVAGIRYRHVFCGQRVCQGRMAVINESDCEQAGDQPEAVEVCNKEGECPSWHVGEWKPCPVMCGDGTQSRTITCHTATNGTVTALADEDCRESGEKPEKEQPCSAVPCEGVDWVTADWFGCSSCGQQFETRDVLCSSEKGKVVEDIECDLKRKPEIKKVCEETQAECEHQWYSSEWSKCNAGCTGGKGVRTRHVFCGSSDDSLSPSSVSVVADDLCNTAAKMANEEECEAQSDKDLCEEIIGEWFTGPFTKCNKKCGGGSQHRLVLCFLNDTKGLPTNCNASSIPDVVLACNNQACKDEDEVTTEAATTPESDDEMDDEESSGSGDDEPGSGDKADVPDEDLEWCEEGELPYDYEDEKYTEEESGSSEESESGSSEESGSGSIEESGSGEESGSVRLRAFIQTDTATVSMGKNLTFSCQVVGEPRASVVWEKDGINLTPGDRVIITPGSVLDYLTVVEATKEDSGRYTCTARNEHGVASSSTAITVEGVLVDPKCIDSPLFTNCELIVRAQWCNDSRYTRFCCLSCTLAGQLPLHGPHLQQQRA